jgi:hypothetical protein
MSLKTMFLAAGSALILSAGAAAAAPAVAESAVNLRAGPGPQYEVLATIPGGATVDLAGCTGSWCQVSFNGETGYASRNYLALAGDVGPSAGVVAVAPGYAYDDTPLYDDYYDYGYAYGPSFGLYASPGYRQGWRGRPGWNGNRVGAWQGRPGANWQGRTGNWQGRAGWQGGGSRMDNVGGGRGAHMAPGSVTPQVSAPAAMGGGASVGGGAAVGAPAGGAAGGSVAAGGGVGARGQAR